MHLRHFSATRRLALWTATTALLLYVPPVLAREFRSIDTVLTPSAEPRGSQGVARSCPVPRRAVVAAVRRIVAAWNTPALAARLSENFFDKSRLTDTLAGDVPRDARLRLLAVQGVHTLDQRIESDPRYGHVLVSTVSATARTQIEFNDSASGTLRRIDGVNELILTVRQRVRP